jgi:thioredoxin reductase (NADPH)
MSGFESGDLDALIIGGGPAGLTCAIYLARYRRKVVVVDSGESRTALIPETHNYPGIADGIAGPSLLEALTLQARTYGVEIISDRITELQPAKAGFEATCSKGNIAARRAVLASGLIDRDLGNPDLQEAVGRGLVRYCPICDGFEASDLRIGLPEPLSRELSEAGIRFPKAHVLSFRRQDQKMTASLSDAVGDAVSDLHQIAVATGHAAVAATDIHNGLPRNFR